MPPSGYGRLRPTVTKHLSDLLLSVRSGRSSQACLCPLLAFPPTPSAHTEKGSVSEEAASAPSCALALSTPSGNPN